MFGYIDVKVIPIKSCCLDSLD